MTKTNRIRTAILIALACALPCLAWTPTGPATPRMTETEHSGKVTGWKLDKDGRVYFRLEGLDRRQKPFTRWFVTPPSQTETTHFERLVLQAVLDLHRRGDQTVVVRSDDSNDAGRSPDDALDVQSIARL